MCTLNEVGDPVYRHNGYAADREAAGDLEAVRRRSFGVDEAGGVDEEGEAHWMPLSDQALDVCRTRALTFAAAAMCSPARVPVRWLATRSWRYARRGSQDGVALYRAMLRVDVRDRH